MDDNTLLILFAFLAILFLSSNGNLTKSICGNLIEGYATPEDRCLHTRSDPDKPCNETSDCSLSREICQNNKCTTQSTAMSLRQALISDDYKQSYKNMLTNFMTNINDPNQSVKCQVGGGGYIHDFITNLNDKGHSYLSGLRSVASNPNYRGEAEQLAKEVLCLHAPHMISDNICSGVQSTRSGH